MNFQRKSTSMHGRKESQILSLMKNKLYEGNFEFIFNEVLYVCVREGLHHGR